MRRMPLFILLIILSGNLLAQSKPATQKAIFAGGCFWCMQSDFDKLKGVTKTTVGYDGGTIKNPTYDLVSSGTTHYVESIIVQYDPKKLTYSQVLNYYWQHIDPTVNNRQFCDVGEQYRSVIFYTNKQQQKLAEQSLKRIQKLFPVVYTQLQPSTHFYPAETYHQDYYLKNPGRYEFYRWRCGRDQRVAEVWKNKALT